jgi:vitamin B12 transporter
LKQLTTYLFVARVAMSLSLLAIPSISMAQEKKLQEVKIRHKKNGTNSQDGRLKSFASGMKILAIDSALIAQYQQHSLGVLLSQQVPVFIKSYGINSMATMNFRGSSAAQSQVIWNGIPLNSASSGITDVSTLSVGNFDQIHIVYGGSSSLLGTGNVGAALLLDNHFEKPVNSKKWTSKLGAELGSFGQTKWSFQEQFAGKKWFLSAKVMQQQANNNFGYQTEQNIWKKMNNAVLHSSSALMNIGYKIDQQTSIRFSIWHQQFHREIPPALFEQYSVKKQTDKALRIFLGFDKEFKSSMKLYAKTAYIEEDMHYEDASILMRNQNKVQQFYQELGWKKSMRHQQELLIFAPITIAWMRQQLDTITRYQNRFAIASAYSIKALKEKLHYALNARFETIKCDKHFLTGTNARFTVHPFVQLRANLQKKLSCTHPK